MTWGFDSYWQFEDNSRIPCYEDGAQRDIVLWHRMGDRLRSALPALRLVGGQRLDEFLPTMEAHVFRMVPDLLERLASDRRRVGAALFCSPAAHAMKLDVEPARPLSCPPAAHVDADPDPDADEEDLEEARDLNPMTPGPDPPAPQTPRADSPARRRAKGGAMQEYPIAVILKAVQLSFHLKSPKDIRPVISLAAGCVMSAEQAAEFEGDLAAGNIRIPSWQILYRWMVKLDMLVIMYQRVLFANTLRPDARQWWSSQLGGDSSPQKTFNYMNCVEECTRCHSSFYVQ